MDFEVVEKEKHAGGAPPRYKSASEIEGIIENYFESCKGEVLKGDKGKPLLDKWNNPIIINQMPPTVTGLALALGFNSRMSLLNYQDKPEFMDTITRAKSRIEAYAEARLFDKDGVNGAKFSLANNFKGWTERQSLELSGPDGLPLQVQPVQQLNDTDLEQMMQILSKSQLQLPE